MQKTSFLSSLTRLLITPVTRGKPVLFCRMSSNIIAKGIAIQIRHIYQQDQVKMRNEVCFMRKKRVLVQIAVFEF